ncbi:MAG: hypothetical protein U0U66_12625 [Cytophagaceae bacterium]
MFLDQWKLIEEYKIIAFILFFTTLFDILCILLWKNGGYILKDLFSGEKIIYSGIVENKYEKENFGWSGNVAVDLVQQPVLIEYVITVEQKHFRVEKDTYDLCKIGHYVQLHFTSMSKELIHLES